MKTASIVLRSAIAVCFAFVMSSASCDLFDKVDDVTFDVVLDHTFHADETDEASDVDYTLMEVLDAADVNSDFAKYKDKIKSITVTSVTYEIQNCEYTTVVSDGIVGFSSVSASTASKVASLSVDNLKAAEGQVKNLDYNQAAIDELSNLLKNDKKANVYFSATLNETPAKFDVKVTVKASITADAL